MKEPLTSLLLMGWGETEKKDLRKVQGKDICSTSRNKFTVSIRNIAFHIQRKNLSYVVVVNWSSAKY